MLTLTDNAQKRVREIITQDKSLEGKALRVLVEGGGCSGMSYGFTFDERHEGDTEVPYEGFKVLVDPQSGTYLQGSIVDYVVGDGLHGSGFQIQNPNAKGSCGCGSSFTV
ncbi:MAG: iron-sulfur cluster assembly accessory protein [Candidatus Omnitrophica bacterium]|nr:iron-sulfur cluster assembly accessory protein [Candidatus Omnitrophota bacterium]